MNSLRGQLHLDQKHGFYQACKTSVKQPARWAINSKTDTKVILTSSQHLKTPFSSLALQHQGTRPSSPMKGRHQFYSQTACRSHWTSFTHQGQIFKQEEHNHRHNEKRKPQLWRWALAKDDLAWREICCKWRNEISPHKQLNEEEIGNLLE